MVRMGGWILFAFAALAAAPALAQDAARVDWELVNPFRFFTDAKATERHRQAYLWLTEEEKRERPILSVERKLAARSTAGWAADTYKATCWDSRQNRHRCPDYASYVHPKAHMIKAVLLDAPELGARNCEWTVRTIRRSHRRRRSRRGKVLRVDEPCNETVELRIPYPAGANVVVRANGRVVARQTIKVRDVFIIGMGDSFGSGEGNPDVPVRFSNDRTAEYGLLGDGNALSGYPARAGQWQRIGDRSFLNAGAKWLGQACHRSLYSHQLRVALQLAIENPKRAVTFVGVACSGAEITAGLFLRYKGNEWVSNPPDLSQISAVAQAQCGERNAPAKDYPEAFHLRGRIVDLQGGLILRKCPSRYARRIDLVLLSIGGNDIGFARLVANAVLKDRTMLRRLGGWFGQVFRPKDVEEPMEELSARYKALDRALRNILHLPWERGRDRVILTGYPGMALLKDGRVCPSGRLGMDVLPQYALDARRALEGEKIGDQLHALMRKAARARGWRIADAHRRQFLGRGICAGDEFSAANELRLPRKVGTYWQPYSPANFEPYASRERWFRTPNDAFMTGNFHVKGTILRQLLRSQRRLQWTQLLLASTYSGAFHPTAEGQAAIADAVVQEARKVLGD